MYFFKRFFTTCISIFIVIIVDFNSFAVLAKDDVTQFQPPKESFWGSVSNLFIPHFEKRNIVLEKESEYFLITVEDSETGKRHLVFNPKKGSQSTIIPAEPEKIITNFMQYSFLSLAMQESKPKRVLFIGMGAGIMPMFLRRIYPNLKMDIVEIDPAIPPIAKKYFGFNQDVNMNIIIKDGRLFLNKCKTKYDLIYIDAYNSKEIPFQLTTLEFFQHAKRSTTPNGILVANIANFGDMDFIFGEFETVSEVYGNISAFLCPWNTNFVLFASKKNLFKETSLLKRCEELDAKYDWNFKLTPFLETRLDDEYIRANTKDMNLITDDFAPHRQ